MHIHEPCFAIFLRVKHEIAFFLPRDESFAK